MCICSRIPGPVLAGRLQFQSQLCLDIILGFLIDQIFYKVSDGREAGGDQAIFQMMHTSINCTVQGSKLATAVCEIK